ncbi:MAG TPA: pentapeptide repeat-containing protein, partial [Candidatus Polarisedimenticolaceae bacterium]|nr:pentapeptide repeat-containing protein [Candidatus Polarisedimenticolaceae bacterium]
MNKRLQKFLDAAFMPYGEFPARSDVTQELLINLQEKFEDLKKQGKGDEEAYQATIDSFGDVGEIMEQLPHGKVGAPTGQSLREALKENLRGMKNSRSKFAHIVLTGADLSDSDLSGADFSGSALKGASFGRSDLSGAKFRGVTLKGASFADARLPGATFVGSDLQDASFDGASLSGTKFHGSALKGATFAKAVLGTTSFSGCDLTGVSFDG